MNVIIITLVVIFVMVIPLRSFLWKETDSGDDSGSDKADKDQFSKVGSGDEEIDLKPIDLSGDAIRHANESLEDDFKKIDRLEDEGKED